MKEKVNCRKKDEDYVVCRFEENITWYQKRAKKYKNTYSCIRWSIIILGAITTLFSTLLATESIDWLKGIVAYIPAFSAAFLTILTGVSQSFKYGHTWKEMMLNAVNLDRELDSYLKDPEPDERKYLETLHKYIIEETESFFDRILGSTKQKK